MVQKIKQDAFVGRNIRKIRLERGLGQTEFARQLQLAGCDITRECLVKIERGTQHIQATQLICMKQVLDVPYEEFFDLSGEE